MNFIFTLYLYKTFYGENQIFIMTISVPNYSILERKSEITLASNSSLDLAFLILCNNTRKPSNFSPFSRNLSIIFRSVSVKIYNLILSYLHVIAIITFKNYNDAVIVVITSYMRQFHMFRKVGKKTYEYTPVGGSIYLCYAPRM